MVARDPRVLARDEIEGLSSVAWRDHVITRMEAIDARHDDAHQWRIATTARIDAIDGAVQSIKKNTEDIVVFFETGRGTIRVLKFVGIAAKWITTVSAAVAVSWLIWKGGKP